MSSNIEVIAIHGWAFDRNCWEKWEGLFPAGTSFSCYDRGYYSRPSTTAFGDNGKKKILLLHSFGLHLCSRELMEQADLAGLFSGFRLFHPTAAQFRRRSRLVLQQMKQKLSEDPEAVLCDFWRNTYHPEEPPRPDMDNRNVALLLKDLDRLDRSELDIGAMKSVEKICIMHGSKDQIVPKSKGRELYNLLDERSRYLEIKNAGHALPMTHAEQCWSFLKPRIENITR